MSEGWQPTGVWDAVLIDVLVRLGHDAGAAMKMSAQERIDVVAAAASEGRLDRQTIEMLGRMGIVTIPVKTDQSTVI